MYQPVDTTELTDWQRSAAERFLKAMTGKSYPLPPGAVHAYVMTYSDKPAQILAMSFKPEVIANIAAKQGKSTVRTYRIAVVKVRGKWHKINIVPVATTSLLDCPAQDVPEFSPVPAVRNYDMEATHA